jgi:hypothetical protein
MKKIELGQTITILANLGVIASLIFVGVQVRQEAAATRSATVLQLKDSWVQLNLVSATSVELADAFHSVGEQGWNGASYRDRAFLEGFYRTLFHNWSNAYYQYQNGTLDETQWEAYLREAGWNAENPVVRQIWSEWGQVYDDSFRSLMDDLIAEVELEASLSTD